MHYGENLESINADLTPDVIKQVNDIIEQFRDHPGALIPVLTACQGVVGYLPVELQEYIGHGLNLPASNIYGVVTFYSFFTMVPKGRHTIKVCMGTACYVRGIGEILNHIQSEFNLDVGGTTDDRRFSLEAVRCLGACGLAPVIVVDNDTHGNVTPESAVSVLEQYE
jgi:NADH-quinone oxidoreductase subunit E